MENANLFEYILKKKMDVLVCKNGSEDLKNPLKIPFKDSQAFLKTQKASF